MIKVTLIGNVGKTPELRFTPAGKAVVDLSIAADKKGEVTTWVRATLWEKQAENANKYLAKGSKVYIEGYLKADEKTGNPRIWNRDDGTPVASLEITASHVEYLTKAEAVEETATPDDDSIPF